MRNPAKPILLSCILLMSGLVACGSKNGASTNPNDIQNESNQTILESNVNLENEVEETPQPTSIPLTDMVQEFRNQAYIDDGNTRHLMDVFLPAAETNREITIVLLHGGGSGKGALWPWSNHFAQMGYTVAAVEFRDYPAFGYPAAVEDVFCALAWINLNAEHYGFNPQRIVTIGHSVGGTLASMLAVVDEPELFMADCPYPWPDEIQVISSITFTGVFDYPTLAEHRENLADYAQVYLGGTVEEIPEIWEQASPANWIDGSEPPFLLLHGELDGNIPASQSEAFAVVLEQAGVPVEYYLVEGKDHFGIIDVSATAELVDQYLEQLIP